jgi:hypothetical protein
MSLLLNEKEEYCMRKVFGTILSCTMLLSLAIPISAYPANQDVLQKIDALTKELEALKHQVKENEGKTKETAKKIEKVEEKSLGRWLTIGGDYRFRYDYLHGKTAPYYQFNPQAPATSPTGPTFFVPGQTVKDNSLYTNRFGLNVNAKATQNVSVTARLLMYKIPVPRMIRP